MSKQTQFLDEIGLNELWKKMCQTFPSIDGQGATGTWDVIAENANKLTTEDVGSTSKPIYFEDGIPKECDDTLNVSISGVSDSTYKLLCKNNDLDTPIVPKEQSMGITSVLKSKTSTGLDKDNQGVVVYRPYGENDDLSKGPVHNLAFDEDGVHHRQSIDGDNWGEWERLITSENFSNWVASNTHKHSVSVTTDSDVASEDVVSVATAEHTHQTEQHNGHQHSYTPEGTIEISLNDDNATTTPPSDESDKKTSVAKGDHTHTLDDGGTHSHKLTPTGTINVSTTNNAVTSDVASEDVVSVADSGHTHSTSSSTSTVDMPNESHTHTYTPQGTIGGADATNKISVSKGGHTHSTSVTSNVVNIPDTNHTHEVISNVTVKNTTFTGTKSETESVSAHIHTVTPTGSINVTINNPKVTSEAPIETQKESVAKGDHSHLINATVEDSCVEVTTPQHTHTVTSNVLVNTTKFTGTKTSTDSDGVHNHTINDCADNVDVPNKDHIHTVELSGNTSSDGAHTHTCEEDGTNKIEVPPYEHTHTTSSNGNHSHTTTSNGKHSHIVTPSGAVTGTFTGSEVESGNPNDTTSVAGAEHVHTVTENGGFTPTGVVTLSGSVDANGCLEISAIFTGNDVPNHTHTMSEPSATVDVASDSHIHNVTAEGSIECSFNGEECTTDEVGEHTHTTDEVGEHSHDVNATEDEQVMVSLSNHIHNIVEDGEHTHTQQGTMNSSIPDTTNVISVAVGSHSHTLEDSGSHSHTYTPEGSVDVTLTNNLVTSSSSDESVVSVAKDSHTHELEITDSVVDVPTMSHTHDVTPNSTVESSLTLNTIDTESGGSHLHIYTPNGTIGVELDNGKVTSTAPDETNVTSVAQGVHTHDVESSNESDCVDVPNMSHTHTFTGTPSETDSPDTINVTSVSLGSHIHDVNATETVNVIDVPSVSHKHSVTPTTVVEATFVGDEVDTTEEGSHTHDVNITTSTIDVPNSKHIHNVTMSAEMFDATFTGTTLKTTQAGSHSHTTLASNDNSVHRVSVPSVSHKHSVTITEDTSQPE